MKKKREISIKDPKLRRIRNNLRILLSKSVSKEWHKYFDERRRLNIDFRGNFRNMSKAEKQRASNLTDKMNAVTALKESSIIQCPACDKIDRDMTFNPELGEWYCTQCYKDMGELYCLWQKKEGRAKKLLFDDFNEEFYKTFLDV